VYSRVATWSCLALLVFATNAFAQGRPGLTKPPAEKGSEFSGLVDGRLGYGLLDEDQFISVNVGTALSFGKLGVGIQVPLRFRMVDNDPKNDSVLRKEDWDEVSDWTRVLRYVEWGKPADPVYVRLGVLSGSSLGHGTIVDRYYNVIDADHYQTGLQLHVDMDVAGGQLLLDNLIDPNIVGARGFVRPFRFVEMAKILNGISVGVSLVIDGAAPRRHLVEDRTDDRLILTGDGEVKSTTETVTIIGLDLDWQLLSTDVVALTPYMDFNVLGPTQGTGFHTGILSTFQLGSAVQLGTRFEYRVMTADYAPSYVNSWYEVERVHFLDGKTKIGYFLDKDKADEDEAQHGFVAQADLTFMKAFTVSAAYEDYQGPDNANLLIRLGLPWIAGVQFNAYYAKRNMNGFDEAFDLDKALAVAEVKYKAYGPLFVYMMYSREWRVNKDENSTEYGKYETINDVDGGVGVEFAF
jgi:hypothetical protein